MLLTFSAIFDSIDCSLVETYHTWLLKYTILVSSDITRFSLVSFACMAFSAWSIHCTVFRVQSLNHCLLYVCSIYAIWSRLITLNAIWWSPNFCLHSWTLHKLQTYISNCPLIASVEISNKHLILKNSKTEHLISTIHHTCQLAFPLTFSSINFRFFFPLYSPKLVH